MGSSALEVSEAKSLEASTIPFSDFIEAFPPEDLHCDMDGRLMARAVANRFEIEVPSFLAQWWAQIGSGYFADRELFVFSDAPVGGRDSIVEWNSRDYWRKLFPAPKEGGPIFFAETCFGAQLGFRWEHGDALGYLLDVDTLECFRVSETLESLFGKVLTDRYAFTDPELLRGVRATIGGLPDGMHYVPIVSPLIGGSLTPQNFHLETANVHLRTSVATWEAMRSGSGGFLGIWRPSMSTKRTQRYFVRRLDERDYRPSPDAEFEVQLLDAAGLAERCAYISHASDDVIALVHATEGRLPVENHGIPLLVIKAAHRCRVGSGEYVDDNGKTIPPAFLPPSGG